MKYAILLAVVASALAAQPLPTVDFTTKSGPLKLTAIQHASFMLEAGGQVVHVDPVGASRYQGLPQADLILITDNHGDHLDLKVIATLRKASATVIAPVVVAEKVEGAKVLKNGESATVGPWAIDAVPMYNIERGPAPGRFYHEKGRGNGYVVTFGGFRLYIAGDTESIPEMKALKNIDTALICMNLPYTMTPEEAAAAVKSFRPKMAIPYHSRGSDLAVFQKALEGTGIEAKILDWYR